MIGFNKAFYDIMSNLLGKRRGAPLASNKLWFEMRGVVDWPKWKTARYLNFSESFSWHRELIENSNLPRLGLQLRDRSSRDRRTRTRTRDFQHRFGNGFGHGQYQNLKHRTRLRTRHGFGNACPPIFAIEYTPPSPVAHGKHRSIRAHPLCHSYRINPGFLLNLNGL